MTPDLPAPDLSALLARAPRAVASARGRASIPEAALVSATFELDETHAAALAAQAVSGTALGVAPARIKSLRSRHHRLAQFLAAGMPEQTAAVLCDYDISRVSILKSDPAFAELLAHYSGKVAEKFEDFHEVAAALSTDAAQEIRRRLDEEPETFTVQTLVEVSKTFADRSGNGPTSTVNANVAVADLAMLERIKQNGAAPVRTFGAEDRRALLSVDHGTPKETSAPEPQG